ncbi:MAG: cation diffusion facilitator family transporter [Mariprofundales bacterium]
MDHADHHHHGLNTAFWLTLAFAIVEIVGGLTANSLALLADAGHMVSDVAALGLALLAQRIAGRAAHAQMTYGYGRARVLAAQMSGLMLWFLSSWIAWEATGRLITPPVVDGGVVLVIATVGLIINLIIMRWLHGSHDLNTRAAYWHVLGDALGSVAAIIAGAVIMWTGWMPIDPILSFLVAVILAWGGWRLVRETTLELMDGVPQGVDPSQIEQAIAEIAGVKRVYHIHIWKLPNDHLALSAHVQITTITDWAATLPLLLKALQHHGIDHVTLQPETESNIAAAP